MEVSWTGRFPAGHSRGWDEGLHLPEKGSFVAQDC